jgi:hypothetical protein
MNTKESGFSPEWDFMNDAKLRQLQLFLDNCYLGAEPETQDKRDLARADFASLWPNIFEEYKKSPETRRLLIKFLRKNFSVLDKGGVGKGNDPQVSALRSANSELIKNHEAEYWDVVKAIEV